MKYDGIIDPGHGGKDPGAVAFGVNEKDLNLIIGKYQYERASELGLNFIMTRSDDRYMTLDEHAQAVQRSGAKICLCGHCNAGGGHGFEIYHSIRHKPTFALCVANALKAKGFTPRGETGVNTRTSKTRSGQDYYRMHYTGDTETIIIEYGFIDNPADLKELQSRYKEAAEAALQGVCQYLGKPYVAKGEYQMKPEDANKIIAAFLGPMYNFVTDPKEKAECQRLADELRKASGQKGV